MASLDFFRKHQKLILYTAGIFALLTFSISGAMMSSFNAWFSRGFRGGTLKLANGRAVTVQIEDHQVAQRLANTNLLPPLLPPIGGPNTSEGERVEILAALRALAIANDIDGSDIEVGEAIRHLLDVWPKTGDIPPLKASDLPAQSRVSSDEYKMLQRESLRIATFLRMAALGGDTSDAALAEKLAADLQVLTFRVASLDKKDLENKAKETAISDDDLKKWLDGLSDAEKMPYQDTNRVAVRAAGLKLAEFDPAAFVEELKGKEYGDKVVEDRYNLDRDAYYRREKKEGEAPPADPYLPLTEVKPLVIKRMQAEDALNAVLEKVRLQLSDHLRAKVEARTAASRDLATKRADQTKADKELAGKPDDEALKKAAETAKAAATAAEQVHKDAEAAVDAERKTFDLEGNLAKATKAKFKFAAVAEPKNADGLRDLPEFGPWDSSWQAGALELVGDLCSTVQNTKEGVFVFQVTDLVKKPLKDFDKVKQQLTDGYYQKKADEQAKATLTKFEDALKRLAREAKKTEVDKLEADHLAAVTQKFDAWKVAAEADKTAAQRKLTELESDRDSVPYKRWQDKLTRVERELTDAEAKRKSIEAGARKETDKKVEDLVKATRKDVLDAAAAEAGMTVETVGPYRKDLNTQPRFEDEYPARVRFLMGNYSLKEMKEGESSDVLEDRTNRAHYLAIVQKVEPGNIDMITRRELVQRREQFAQSRRIETVVQSFTLEALRKGWGYVRSEGEADTAQAAPKTASGGAAADGKPK